MKTLGIPITTLGAAEIGAILSDKAPIAVRAIDLEETPTELRLPASRGGRPYRRLLGLLRRGGSPIGWAAFPVDAEGVCRIDGDPDADRHDPSNEQAEAEGLLSVVIATCAKPERVVPCVEAILAAARGECEVIVVENRPRASKVGEVIAACFDGERGAVHYVEEEEPGLSAARNAGLRAARGELVAFTDDDVTVDPGWIAALRRGFAVPAAPDCVTGLIAPLELETPAQLLDERFASYGKGFARRAYSLAEPPPDQPLFPYATGHFASGANLAFRTAALRELGGFDPVLSTGTRARGGEDLDICLRLLLDGRVLVYEPAAIIWHRHPDTFAQVKRQVFDYGAGLGAMATKQLLHGPDRHHFLGRIVPGLRYYVADDSRKNETRGPAFPASLLWRERLGLLYGPIGYAASALSAPRHRGDRR
jgi:GT2 family glycosyltransferase